MTKKVIISIIVLFLLLSFCCCGGIFNNKKQSVVEPEITTSIPIVTPENKPTLRVTKSATELVEFLQTGIGNKCNLDVEIKENNQICFIPRDNSLVFAAVGANNGNKECKEAWFNMVYAMQALSLKDDFKGYGLHIVNSSNKDLILLSITNGIVVYNSVNY